MPSTSRSHGNKTAPGSSILLSKDEVIELLLEVARKAYYALEDSEERGEGSLVPSENAMELQAALDALEGLPAAPGYVSCGPNNAKYALRSFEAQAADAEREVAEVWDKKVTPRSESAPSFVWAVESKTSFALFGTEEAAKQYVSGFPASVGGGMGIAKLAVIGGQK